MSINHADEGFAITESMIKGAFFPTLTPSEKERTPFEDLIFPRNRKIK